MAANLTERHVSRLVFEALQEFPLVPFAGLRFLEQRLGPKFTAGVVLYTGTDLVRFGKSLWAAPMSALWS